uniref:LRRCT domain-containing protein n=1 Tax=Branchiostoma floridae TaxID=7739 RepID=C3XQT5_BRAFL|eukprot:XP_002613521.1 hypothetical protein BRAFLDRAFT_71866 [Branchiostoma floridae]
MLFICMLLLTAACEASNGPILPRCKSATWLECVPKKPGLPLTMTFGTHACVMCKSSIKGAVFANPFPLIAGANSVAIRGYPFYVLSEKKLAPLQHYVIHTLGMIDAKITDVENNTFAGLSNLQKLSLDSNRLTNVKPTWFIGLKKLLVLSLSNNKIMYVEPGSFVHLAALNVLDLENNLLRFVDPAWLFGLKGRMMLSLRLNTINSISPGSFRQLSLTWLDLMGNDLSCLDGDVLRGQPELSALHISSGMLSSAYGIKPCEMKWSLRRMANYIRESATMVVEVPKFLFCARYIAYELSLGWMFDSMRNVPRNIELGRVNPGRSCGALDRSLSTISIQTPTVVLATDGSLADKLVPNTLEQCRQVWEYHGGITVTVGLVGSPIFRLLSIGNTSFEGVGMTFVQTHDTNTLTTTESGRNQKQTTHRNSSTRNIKNITCILLTKDEHTELFFTVPPVQCQTHSTLTTYSTDTDYSSSLSHYSDYSEKHDTSSELDDNTTPQESNIPEPEVRPETNRIHIVVLAVVGLAVSAFVVLVWKVCSSRSNVEDEGASDDAHIWTIPPDVTFPGLLRSASLPARPIKVVSDDAVSCMSLPATLNSIEPTYSEIPDDMAIAQRPLPGLPHTYCEISDDAISSIVRSSSLPAVTWTDRGDPDDAASCRSLPAVLQSIEPTYSEIPDHIAAAHRPLPALPRAKWEAPHHDVTPQHPLPASSHTYTEIPDESGLMPFYADDADFSFHVVGNTTTSSRHRSGRSIATYGLAEQTKVQRNNFYRKAPEEEGLRAHRQLRTALVSQTAEQGLRRYINVTDAMLSRRQHVTQSHIAFLTLPDAHWPLEISENGARITPRRASLPLVTLPNTYRPWDITGEISRMSMTPRGASLPLVTLPNTYWPWHIPSEGAHNTPRRACLPLVTLPNTYWPWHIRREGAPNTPRHAYLPLVTMPNTY